MSDALSQANGQAVVRAKNTFLEFKFCPDDDSDLVRRVSAPSCIARSRADEEMWSSETSTCGDDHEVWSSEELESDNDTHENPMQDDLLEDKTYYDVELQTSEFLTVTSNVLRQDALEEETLSQCTESQTDQLCTMLPISGRAVMRTKATFLEFKFIAYDECPPVRRSSAPSCLGFPSSGDDMWKTEVSAIESCDQLLWTSDDAVSRPHTDEHQQVLADTLSDKSLNADFAGDMSHTLEVKHKSPSKAKRDRTRHCKEKRMRYKKFMLRLCEKINEDPVAFDVARIQWPPSLIDNTESREYLLDIVEAHRARALEGFATKEDVCNEASLQLELVL